MADKTKIEWADATVNAVNGCSVLSPGCTNCYAMKLAGTRLRHHPSRAGLTDQTKAGPVWNGKVSLNEDQLLQPLKWKRPRRIFWNAHGDLFHEAVPDEWIDRVFAVCALTPQHTHMILTKRSARMREYAGRLADYWHGNTDAFSERMACAFDNNYWWPDEPGAGVEDINWPLPNVWLGVSVEDQTRADERIPDLLATPAALRFISAEPLLGPVDVAEWMHDSDCWLFGFPTGHDGDRANCTCSEPREDRIDWVIVGGESGAKARPMHPDWARSLRDQCHAAGVPFFFKQWGEWGPDLGPRDDCHPGTTIKRDPIFEGKARCAVRVGDDWRHFESGYSPPIELCSGHGEWVYRLGKRANGHLLDGTEHFEFPAVAHA